MSQPSTPRPPAPPALDARGLPVGYPFKPDWENTPRQVDQMRREDKDFILLDCRGLEEWQTTRIEGAVLIPMEEIERRADELESESGGRDQPIVVHCHHGVRSMRVTAHLRGLGFTDVRSMAGGIDLWSIAVDPGVKRY